MNVARAEVVLILQELGLELWQAEQAADDAGLDWDVPALQRCIKSIRESTADRPAAVLWSMLSKHHQIPTAKAAPKLRIVAEDGPAMCPVCKEDWGICEGMHGWAAQFRGMTAAEIYPVFKQRPRRTRKGPNTR